MIYLASPYSHPESAIRNQRYLAACRAAVELFRSGKTVFSPIVHGHALTKLGLATDWGFWRRHDHEHLRRCDEVVVLMLDGWRESKGVTEEIQFAAELAKPVSFISPAAPRLGKQSGATEWHQDANQQPVFLFAGSKASGAK